MEFANNHFDWYQLLVMAHFILNGLIFTLFLIILNKNNIFVTNIIKNDSKQK